MTRLPPNLPPHRPPRSPAHLAFLVNAGLCPGMGSWMLGRRVEGAAQFLLATSGFVLVCIWFITLAKAMTRILTENVDPWDRIEYAWFGLGVFAIAWLWGMWTGWRALQRERARTGGAS